MEAGERCILKKRGTSGTYDKSMIGYIVYSAIWHKYSLIVHVEGTKVVCLDAFGEVNHAGEHKLREHYTALRRYDEVMNTAEFYARVKGEEKCS